MRALREEAEIELGEVIERTPIKYGNLRASEHIEGPFVEQTPGGVRIWCSIVAGGPSAPYAIYVHENPDAIHPVGQYKYIESVLVESQPHMGARVAARMRAEGMDLS